MDGPGCTGVDLNAKSSKSGRGRQIPHCVGSKRVEGRMVIARDQGWGKWRHVGQSVQTLSDAR